jgi:hypothetical protein
MFDRFKEVTKEHAMRTMEALGKYHALSFALRDQKPELFEPYKSLEDIFSKRNQESMAHTKAWLVRRFEETGEGSVEQGFLHNDWREY